jgi:hypothetical protein
VTEYGYEILDLECYKFYRAEPVATVSKELAKCKLDLVGLQEVRWNDGGTELAGEYISCGKGMRNKNSVQSFVQNRIISAVTRVEFVTDRMAYITLRGRWGHIIVLNVHPQT